MKRGPFQSFLIMLNSSNEHRYSFSDKCVCKEMITINQLGWLLLWNI